MEGYSFSTDVRVRFADTDAQGIAHNASYLVWFEVARVEYLRAHAGGYQALRDLGIEVLRVHARCVDLRGARFRYEYAIVRDDGTLMAEGFTAHACVDAATFKPTRVPGWLADAIASAESSSASTPAASST
jgi:acyl-CoA thioester hydrolase